MEVELVGGGGIIYLPKTTEVLDMFGLEHYEEDRAATSVASKLCLS